MAITLDGTNGILSPDFEPSSSTTPTNGLFLPAANTVGLATGSTERLRIDSSGNLGLGVTPSAWEAGTRKAFQLGLGGSVSSDTAANSILLSSNAVNASTGWKYINTDYASNYYQSGGAHVWRTAPSGTAGNAISFTQAMTLDASGALQLGTTQASGSKQAIKTSAGNTTIGASLGLLISGKTAGSVVGERLEIGFRSWEAYNSYTGSMVGIGAITTSTTGNELADLYFYTTNTASSLTPVERARIDSSGNLLVGTTSQYGSAKVSVNGFVASSATGGGVFYTNTTINEEVAFGSAKSIFGGAYVATDACIYTGKSTSKIYAVAYTQGVYLNTSGTSWTSNSDERLKTDLKPIENAAQKVSTLRAVTGRYKTDKQDVSRSFLIAQDVQAVLPEAVDASDPDKLGVQYTDTIPLLVAAIKELTTRLEALENK